MAPIRDWTGAITISPLPYCEIAAVGIWCGDCHNRPSEAQHSGFGSLQAALQASPFACMEKSTIRHL